tara:strand:+ start:32 stop:571 length:540 start_codon:yes stop_codon:yes gene_type:complete
MNKRELKATIFAFVMILVHPSFASAEVDNYIGGRYISMDYSGHSINGWGVGWSAIDEKYTLGVGFSQIEDELDIVSAGFEYAFGNQKEGSAYIGVSYGKYSIDGESDSNTSLNIGYSKWKYDEVSWDVWLGDGEESVVIGASIRVPVAEQLGITVGIATEEDEDGDNLNALFVGISYKF